MELYQLLGILFLRVTFTFHAFFYDINDTSSPRWQGQRQGNHVLIKGIEREVGADGWKCWNDWMARRRGDVPFHPYSYSMEDIHWSLGYRNPAPTPFSSTFTHAGLSRTQFAVEVNQIHFPGHPSIQRARTHSRTHSHRRTRKKILIESNRIELEMRPNPENRRRGS